MPEGTWDQLLNVTQARLGPQAGGDRRKLALDKLAPNPDQPRKFFDAAALDDLAASLKVHGVLQPLLVRPHPRENGRWQIVAGERRWLAATQAGLTEVPVVVRELDDRLAREIGLVENVLREDITPMEEARALRALLDETGWSYAQLGDRLGKNKAWVDHRVRLLKMPSPLQEALERQIATPEGKLQRPFTPRHAGAVVQVPEEQQAELVAAVFAEGLSVAELDRRVKAMLPVVLNAAPETVLPDGDALPPLQAAQPARGRPARLAGKSGGRSGRVAIGSLQTHALLEQARRADGTVEVAALLVALAADQAALLARQE
ncbi:MAG: ParB/RepB/Spo0J family partition protein [Candidatus Sericytochromatia bacterium]|nr:ParB/RepB/Spo0J family partition protein [Candidatus Sericytochromatia bacterium]